jgi:hypothetical protein
MFALSYILSWFQVKLQAKMSRNSVFAKVSQKLNFLRKFGSKHPKQNNIRSCFAINLAFLSSMPFIGSMLIIFMVDKKN